MGDGERLVEARVARGDGASRLGQSGVHEVGQPCLRRRVAGRHVRQEHQPARLQSRQAEAGQAGVGIVGGKDAAAQQFAHGLAGQNEVERRRDVAAQHAEVRGVVHSEGNGAKPEAERRVGGKGFAHPLEEAQRVVVAVGGYDSSSFAEDMDLIMRMISYMCELNQPYRIPHVAETTCWTEGPPTLWSLSKQRTRWARGLMQCMFVHRKLLFNPRYKRLGLITYPFMFMFEFIAPIIELIGYISLIWFILIGAVNWTTFWVILLMLYTFNEFMLLVICFFSYYVEDPSNRNSKWDYLWLFIASLFEPIIYHPLIVFFSVKGYFSFLTKRSFKWEDIKREGFGKERLEEEERKRRERENNDETAVQPV